MKNKTRLVRFLLAPIVALYVMASTLRFGFRSLFAASLPMLAILCLTACQLNQAAAQTVRGVTEIAATAVYQGNLATVAELTQLSTDLKGYPNTPLSPRDNQLIANIVSELTRKKAASITGGSAVDALNNAITALSSTQNATPSLLTGINWAAVQDVALGISDSVNYITKAGSPNPATTAARTPNSPLPYRVYAMR